MMDTKAESEPTLPPDLRKALAAWPEAKANWNNLTAVGRWDFVTWIETAMQAETRKERIERACDMVAGGKRRPCCYNVVPFDLQDALKAVPKAKAKWSTLSSTERREIIFSIVAVKAKDARRKQIDKACASLAGAKTSR